MNNIKSGIITSVAILIILSLFIFAKDYYKTDNQTQNKLKDTCYSVLAIQIPDQVSFAGESVPLNNFDAREALDKELLKITYWHSETILLLKRANRYFPIIEKILSENGIHDDFKYMAIAESGLTDAISPSGASGFWQFMKKTAESYGLEVNDEVDERFHLEKSTVAACKFLKDAKKKYNNWALVSASYNLGQGNLDKQIEKQKTNNFYDLLLNTETSRYVYRLIAFKLILSNPELYGFKIDNSDLYDQIPVYKIPIESAIPDLAQYAIDNGTNYKMLKYFNPWLRDNTLTNPQNKKYTILLPEKNARSLK